MLNYNFYDSQQNKKVDFISLKLIKILLLRRRKISSNWKVERAVWAEFEKIQFLVFICPGFDERLRFLFYYAIKIEIFKIPSFVAKILKDPVR
ncbi:hypothetical protein BpHYR1_025123 [Brachionus plicatilis]|uniref:Uncharacterized protein n=1 Tax=Brachionus plicatilis TaxID=10195 RepID=A0A3M7RS83_BRAPC|nr:hypothetical protein BpHYR1_025123 [Brachionus plicatilis]